MSKLQDLLKRQKELLDSIDHLRKMISISPDRIGINAGGYSYWSPVTSNAAVDLLKLELEAKVAEADEIAEKLSLIDKLIS